MQIEITPESAPQPEVGILELLAFNLLLSDLQDAKERELQAPPVSTGLASAPQESAKPAQPPNSCGSEACLEAARIAWQEDRELRMRYRFRARRLSERFTASGIRARSSDAKLVASTLEWVKTIPPRSAYGADELG